MKPGHHQHRRCSTSKPGVTDSSFSEMRATPGNRHPRQFQSILRFGGKAAKPKNRLDALFFFTYPGWRLSSLELVSLTPGYVIKRLRRIECSLTGRWNRPYVLKRLGQSLYNLSA